MEPGGHYYYERGIYKNKVHPAVEGVHEGNLAVT